MKRIVTTFVLVVSVAACSISTQQEQQMGQDYARQINAQLPIISDPEINRYINVLGDSLARTTARRDLDWRFYVVDAMDVNAFAVPGGYVYVNRGLIQRTDEMSEVAGVLGHEIAHVVRRHSVQQMEKAQNANIGVTLACVLTSICNSDIAQAGINIAGTAVFAKFSRDDEREADVEGFNTLVRAGISPVGMVEMFNKLLQERRRGRSAVAGWFATHPGEEERVAAIQARISQMPSGTMSRLRRNSSNFAAFKRRLQSLPPSPPPRRLR